MKWKKKFQIPRYSVAGIYIAADRLRLPKGCEPKDKPKIIVPMQSGRCAIFRYAEFERGWNVDWGWHHFEFKRYARADEIVDRVTRVA